jgi:hypothetical protein
VIFTPSADQLKMASPKKTAVKKPPKSHPAFLEMAVEAISDSTDTKGASVPSIRNYITEKYKSVDPTTVRYRLKQALTKALEQNMIKKSKQSDDRPLMASRFRMVATKKKTATINEEDKDKKVVKPKKTKTKTPEEGKSRAQKKASKTVKPPAKSPKKSPAKLARKNPVKVPKPKVIINFSVQGGGWVSALKRENVGTLICIHCLKIII